MEQIKLFCKTDDKRYFIYTPDTVDFLMEEVSGSKYYSEKKKFKTLGEVVEIKAFDYAELLATIAQAKVMSAVKSFREATADMTLEEFMEAENNL